MAALVESRRQSPLCLPTEIVTDIFLYLTLNELLLSLSVCKEWNHTLRLDRLLWRNLEVPNNPSHDEGAAELCERGCRKVLSWAGTGGAKRIVMGTRERAGETLTLLLKESPNLEHLEYAQQGEDLLLPSDEQRWERLKYVAIHGFNRALRHNIPDVPGGFPRTFLQNAASSLKHLTLDGIPIYWHNKKIGESLASKIPLLPQLKTLRIKDGWRTPSTQHLPLFNLSDAFPGLEQLYLRQHVGTLVLGPSPSSRKREDVWPHLKVLLIEADIRPANNLRDSLFLPFKYLTCIGPGNLLQHIRFDFVGPSWSCIFKDRRYQLPPSDDTQVSDFQSLRSYRSCKLPMSPRGARNLASHAIQTGQLSSFDIVFPYHVMNRGYLLSYKWLCGAPSIVSLGCYEFKFEYYPDDAKDLCLPQFLATFPNLQTLSIGSTDYGIISFTHLVEVILGVTSPTLKTVYIYHYNNHPNVNYLRQAAARRGVELITGERPQQWPMSLS